MDNNKEAMKAARFFCDNTKGKFDVGVKCAMHLARLKDLNFQYAMIELEQRLKNAGFPNADLLCKEIRNLYGLE